ncbi:MAG: dihydrofolate reductase [Lawsonella sp.]|nr:dihydrofolate reductase [Mycobacteriales bacterium]
MLGMIWAQSQDGWIGRDGAMPWHVPEDLRHFKEVTLSHPVIMGRRTWDSLNPRFRPLPGRTNIVLTRSQDWAADGAVVVHSAEEALAAVADAESAWVMGGSHIYDLFLPYADRCEVTELDIQVPDGDTPAPSLSELEWEQVSAEPWHTSRSGIRYRFTAYQRPHSLNSR